MTSFDCASCYLAILCDSSETSYLLPCFHQICGACFDQEKSAKKEERVLNCRKCHQKFSRAETTSIKRDPESSDRATNDLAGLKTNFESVLKDVQCNRDAVKSRSEDLDSSVAQIGKELDRAVRLAQTALGDCVKTFLSTLAHERTQLNTIYCNIDKSTAGLELLVQKAGETVESISSDTSLHGSMVPVLKNKLKTFTNIVEQDRKTLKQPASLDKNPRMMIQRKLIENLEQFCINLKSNAEMHIVSSSEATTSSDKTDKAPKDSKQLSSTTEQESAKRPEISVKQEIPSHEETFSSISSSTDSEIPIFGKYSTEASSSRRSDDQRTEAPSPFKTNSTRSFSRGEASQLDPISDESFTTDFPFSPPTVNSGTHSSSFDSEATPFLASDLSHLEESVPSISRAKESKSGKLGKKSSDGSGPPHRKYSEEPAIRQKSDSLGLFERLSTSTVSSVSEDPVVVRTIDSPRKRSTDQRKSELPRQHNRDLTSSSSNRSPIELSSKVPNERVAPSDRNKHEGSQLSRSKQSSRANDSRSAQKSAPKNSDTEIRKTKEKRLLETSHSSHSSSSSRENRGNRPTHPSTIRRGGDSVRDTARLPDINELTSKRNPQLPDARREKPTASVSPRPQNSPRTSDNLPAKKAKYAETDRTSSSSSVSATGKVRMNTTEKPNTASKAEKLLRQAVLGTRDSPKIPTVPSAGNIAAGAKRISTDGRSDSPARKVARTDPSGVRPVSREESYTPQRATKPSYSVTRLMPKIRTSPGGSLGSSSPSSSSSPSKNGSTPAKASSRSGSKKCHVCCEDQNTKLYECRNCTKQFHDHCHLPPIEPEKRRIFVCTNCAIATSSFPPPSGSKLAPSDHAKCCAILIASGIGPTSAAFRTLSQRVRSKIVQDPKLKKLKRPFDLGDVRDQLLGVKNARINLAPLKSPEGFLMVMRTLFWNLKFIYEDDLTERENLTNTYIRFKSIVNMLFPHHAKDRQIVRPVLYQP